jgi:hypothetical protein
MMIDVTAATLVPKTAKTPMDELSSLQRLLVEHYVDRGGKRRDAIEAAGYGSLNAGYAAFKSDRVVAAITWLTRARLALAAPRALNTVISLASGARSEKVMLEAAQDLLNRAGFHAEPAQGLQLTAGHVNILIDLG